MNFNNIDFINKINSTKILLLSFIIWAILYITAPLVIKIETNTDAFFFIIISVFSFVIGYKINQKTQPNIVVSITKENLSKLFKIVVFIALIGFLLKIFDRFIIRGISLSNDFFTNRESMSESSGNIIGVISTFLAPFGIIPLFFYYRYQMKLNSLMKFFVYFIFFSQFLDAIFLGSRSIIFIIAILFFLYLFYIKKMSLNIKKGIIILLTTVSLTLVMNYIFIERTKLFAGDNAYSMALNTSAYNFTSTSSNDFKQEFNNAGELKKTIYFSYINTIQYFTHGIFEFSYLYDKFNKEHALGGYTFNVYNRFFYKISGNEFNNDNLLKLTPRVGVYTSFFGPLFIDFGWFTPLIMLIFGFVLKNIYINAIVGYDWAILMVFYFFIVLMFSPVFNFISGGGGIFILTSLIIFYFLSKKLYKKTYLI